MNTQRKTVRTLASALALTAVLSAGLAHPAAAAPKAPTDEGTLDPTFGQNGIVVSNLFTAGTDMINALVAQPGGKILGGGIYNNSFDLVRYNANGSLDTTFGNGGLVTTDPPPGYQWQEILALAQQPDGKIVAGGYAAKNDTFNSADMALARYNADGSLDPTFANGGELIYDLMNGEDKIYGLGLQRDGKIVAAISDGSSIIAGRFNPDGSWDAGFGNNQGAEVTGLVGHANALAVQADDRIVIAGDVRNVNGYDYAQAVTLRLAPDGALDAGFGDGGVAVTPFGDSWTLSAFRSVVVQPDGRIVAGGDNIPSTGTEFALARYNTDGSLDAGFGDGGRVTTKFTQDGPEVINALALQPDGKIIAAGRMDEFGSNFDFAICRYNPDGSRDLTIGNRGRAYTDVSTLFPDEANAMLVQANGTIVTAGYSSDLNFTRNEWKNTALVAYLGGDAVPPPPPPPPPPPGGCTVPFTDITGNPFATYIQDLYCRHIVDGYADNTFRPYNQATRGTLAKWVVLSRGWALDTTGGPHFTDVPMSDPLYGYIETAYGHGVLSGYADHTFRPTANVTRGQMSKMIVNAMGWAPVAPTTPHFRDVNAANPFYSQIETIYAHGLVSGYNCGAGCLEFRWGNDNTRGQLTKVLDNALGQ